MDSQRPRRDFGVERLWEVMIQLLVLDLGKLGMMTGESAVSSNLEIPTNPKNARTES